MTYHFDQPGTLKPPGVIGRIVRLLMGPPLLWLVRDLLLYSDSGSLSHLGIWAWALFTLWVFPPVINIGWGSKWSNATLRIPVVVLLGFSVAISQLLYGVPLTALTWWPLMIWMTYTLAHLGFSFILAAALGTPGCEMRALSQLVGMLRGKASSEHFCPGFLTGLDRWEAGLSANRS
jgi:hypothetical protein